MQCILSLSIDVLHFSDTHDAYIAVTCYEMTYFVGLNIHFVFYFKRN